MAGELADAEKALEQVDELSKLDEAKKASKEDLRLLELLQRLYRAYAKKQFTGVRLYHSPDHNCGNERHREQGACAGSGAGMK